MKYTEHSTYFEKSSLTVLRSLLNFKGKKEIITHSNQMLVHILYLYSMNFNTVFEVFLNNFKLDKCHVDCINLYLKS